MSHHMVEVIKKHFNLKEVDLHKNKEYNKVLNENEPYEAAVYFINKGWTTEEYIAKQMDVTIDRLRAWMDGGRTMNDHNATKLLTVLIQI